MFSMPCFSVAEEDGQPLQAPCMCSRTMPSRKPRNTMSPPSPATAGRTRVSSSSLICATISASSGATSSSAAAASASSTGRPATKCSITAPSTCGFSVCQADRSDLVTVTKSPPRNTRDTPGSANSALASGLRSAASAVAKSAVPAPITSRPGRNFSVAGLGVLSVSMNMGASCCRMGTATVRFRLHRAAIGR